MADRIDTTITFTAGNYSVDYTTWVPATHAPTATISVTLFRAIFDAAGDETIDTSSDIDPGVLLGILRLAAREADSSTAWLRLVCQWARRRTMRVRFELSEALTTVCTAE